MQDTHVKICAWTGPIFIALFLIGYIGLAGFMPPISPADSPELVANYYKENALSLKFGLVLMMIGLGFSMPFLAAMTVQLKKICSPAVVLS